MKHYLFSAMSQSGSFPRIPTPNFTVSTTVIDPSSHRTSDIVDKSSEVRFPSSTSDHVHRVSYPDSGATTAGVTDICVATAEKAAASVIEGFTNKAQQETLSTKSYVANKGYKSKRTFKVIIVGDAGVGKTCLSFRFCCGRFPEHTEATIGVDFRERSCVIEKELLKVQLWDTAGQERYRQSIVAHYYRNVSAVVFVYDVTCKKSFDSLNIWISECEKHGLTSSGEVPRILIGNKCDISSTGDKVSTDLAQIFADKNNMALFETSAKSASEADHVESIFLTLLHKLQQSKPMHVQSSEERSAKEQEKLVLKAEERAALADDGFCC